MNIAVANWIRFEVYMALHTVKYVIYAIWAHIDACSEVLLTVKYIRT